MARLSVQKALVVVVVNDGQVAVGVLYDMNDCRQEDSNRNVTSRMKSKTAFKYSSPFTGRQSIPTNLTEI